MDNDDRTHTGAVVPFPVAAMDRLMARQAVEMCRVFFALTREQRDEVILMLRTMTEDRIDPEQPSLYDPPVQ